MATLQRTEAELSRSTRPSLFDAAAVPLEFDSSQWRVIESEDLISLGEEQLFSGTRGAGSHALLAPPPAQSTSSPLSQVTTAPSTPIMSDELHRSLGAAKQSFLLALNGLLQQHLETVRMVSPALTPSVESSTTTTNPFLPTFSAAANGLTIPAPSRPTSTADPNYGLAGILDALRSHSGSPANTSRSSPAMRDVSSHSPLVGSHSTSRDGLIEELQTRLETVATEMSPTDAELAQTLGALLACIERLLDIARLTGSSQLDAELPPGSQESPQTQSSVYVDLEREVSTLQSARGDMDESVVGAVREVEMAERDLLWGRVDDLSERVRQLCRQRVETSVAGRSDDAPASSQKEYEARQDALFDEAPAISDLPRYSMDSAYLPPAYHTDGSEKTSTDVKHDWEKPPPSPDFRVPEASTTHARTRGRRVSSLNSAQTQRDLESVSLAIERLYIVSPQLANQRVEPDRRGLRERQLAKLGNAIERLSKGRLNDQRAKASPIPPELEGEQARRIERIHDAALDKLILQIDRAASRTMLDQRVDVKSLKRKELSDKPSFYSDPVECQRRQYILEHTGKGRLASQDATFNNAGVVERFPRAPSPSEPVTITEFFRQQPQSSSEEARPRSNSSPSRPIIKKRFSGLFPGRGEEDASNGNATASGSNGNKKSLRLGVLKMGSVPTALRRGSYDSRIDAFSAAAGLGLTGSGMSRTNSADLDVDTTSPLDYVAEESRNLGTIVVTFWPRLVAANKENWEVVAVESNSILVAPGYGGPATRISLPSTVIPQTATVTAVGSCFEIKLVTVPPSPTRSRPDLEIHYPLSSFELQNALPRTFSCAKCNQEIADTASIVKYNALPSEHWAELLDAWMCHQDQTLSDDLVQKGKGIKPRHDEGLVGSSYLLLNRAITKQWVTPAHAEFTRSEGDDFLYPAHCTSCGTLIGQHVVPLNPSSNPATPLPSSFMRLFKYASVPSSLPSQSSTGALLPVVPKYSLASHLTAEMLEIGQAHACHRFLIQDSETETVRLLLWLFNPAVRVSFSTTTRLGSKLEEPGVQKSFDFPGRPVQRAMNAVKVFYAVVENEQDQMCQDFVKSDHTTPEKISYPLATTSQLIQLLAASSAVYPAAKRNWAEYSVGFLERI